ncbi:hypothetical protein FSP39_000151 [Pinctada imbricata]|uniref:Tyrosinase copper-binding domain-containing protein n=1 Tax=Pinctada imbricata TaxID=66713 RepID=A0AA88Y482_PINIB|nr:hypothetical protein FSP39_000151 [Pinctada imbricata]
MYQNEPAERIATTCLTNYAWTVTGVRCGDVSPHTLDLIGGLLLPYLCNKKKPKEHRVRKEYRVLSEEERYRFHYALNVLKENGTYDEIAGFHSIAIGGAAHAGPAFLPWHRVYLFILENALRKIDPYVTIPYWDSNLDHNMLPHTDPIYSIIWSPLFVGNGDAVVNTGPFASWNISRNIEARTGDGLISTDELQLLYNLTIISNTTWFRGYCEFLHNLVHVWVGGFMTRIDTAPRDPIFFLHHSYIDYLWWKWQKDNIDRPETWEYPADFNIRPGHNASDILLNLDVGGRNITSGEGYGREWAFDYFTYESAPDCMEGTCVGPYLRCKDQTGKWRDEFSYEHWKWDQVQVTNDTISCVSVSRPNDTSITSDQSGQTGEWSGRKKRSVESKVAADIHASLAHSYAAPLVKSKGIRYPTIEVSEKLDLPESQFYPGAHPGLRVIQGHPVQNDFRINCDQDYHLWAFLPIKVIHLRPYGKMYDSYPVSNGVFDNKLDIYSDIMYKKCSFPKPQNPVSSANCLGDDTGYTRIIIRSDGLNYYGLYHDYVILDDRQPIDGKVGYIGIRRPNKKPTKVMITAHDHCGRICVPKCLKKGSNPPKYVPCSGAIKVDNKAPRLYGNTYGEAVQKYWSTTTGSCPMDRGENVYMIFYCDYKTNWFPWPGASKCKQAKSYG